MFEATHKIHEGEIYVGKKKHQVMSKVAFLGMFQESSGQNYIRLSDTVQGDLKFVLSEVMRSNHE